MLVSDGSLLMGVAALITSLANLIAVLRQRSARYDNGEERPEERYRRYDR